MTLRNEIFEGLGAATAAKKLVYNPQDDYAEQLATAARHENETYDILKKKREEDAKQNPNQPAPTGVPTMPVPTMASAGTPGMPQQLPPWWRYPPPSVVNPRAAQGGAIHTGARPPMRYADGGSVSDQEQESEADQIVRSLLSRVVGQAQPPPDPTADWARQGSREQNRQTEGRSRMRAMERDIPPPADYPQGVYDPPTPRKLPLPSSYARAAADEASRPPPSSVEGSPVISSGYGGQKFGGQKYGGQKFGNDRVNYAEDPSVEGSPVIPPSDDQERIADEQRPNNMVRPGPPYGPPAPQSRQASVEGSPVVGPTIRERVRGPIDQMVDRVHGDIGIMSGGIDDYIAARNRVADRAAEVGDRAQDAYVGARNRFADNLSRPGASVEGSPAIPQQALRPDVPQSRSAATAPPPLMPPSRLSPPTQPTTSSFEEPPRAPTTSDIGRVFGTEQSPEAQTINDLNAKKNALVAQRQAADIGIAQQATELDRQQARQRIAEIDRQIAAVDQQIKQAGQPSAPPAPPTGPTGTATAKPPPAGAGTANTPSTAPKEGYQRYPSAMNTGASPFNYSSIPPDALKTPPASTGGGARAPAGPPARLSMSDPNRTAAYNPADPQDYYDPTRRRTNEELAQVMAGAATMVRPGANGGPPPVGHLAVSRHVGQAYVAAHSQGGKWTPGEAILRGMLSDYKTLLSMGRIAQANQMAYGLMQYANMEASAHAHVSADRVKAGDFGGALQGVVDAANYLPDGMEHKVGPDGRSVQTVDPRTGKVTATTPVDGRWLLAAVAGLRNGDLFWASLAAAAQQLKGGNTESRDLSNAIRRNTLLLQEQRLKKGLQGGRPGAAPLSAEEKRLQELSSSLSGVPRPPKVYVPGQQTAEGDNDSLYMVDPPLEPGEAGYG